MHKEKSHYYQQKIDACKATDLKMGWKIINSLIGKGNKPTLINDCLGFGLAPIESNAILVNKSQIY